MTLKLIYDITLLTNSIRFYVKSTINANQMLQAKSFHSDGMQNLPDHDVRGGKDAP